MWMWKYIITYKQYKELYTIFMWTQTHSQLFENTNYLLHLNEYTAGIRTEYCLLISFRKQLNSIVKLKGKS